MAKKEQQYLTQNSEMRAGYDTWGSARHSLKELHGAASWCPVWGIGFIRPLPSAALGWFASEWEAIGMTLRTSKSEAIIVSQKQVDLSLLVRGDFLEFLEVSWDLVPEGGCLSMSKGMAELKWEQSFRFIS